MKKTFKKFVLFVVVLVVVSFSALLLPIFTTTANSNISYATSSNNITYFGNPFVCGKDNGYVPNKSSTFNYWSLLTTGALGAALQYIPRDDPHAGWSLGQFYVKGYSGRTESDLNSFEKNVPVYLKNTGDTVEFGFKLDQNIKNLNGNKNLEISDDVKMVQDCWMQEPYIKGDFHHGVLVVVKTDYQGKQDMIVYRDYLQGLRQGANTSISLFEEGDYRVILAYEIYVHRGDSTFDWFFDFFDPNGSFFDYRIESYFSIRNGNSMVFPFEKETNVELYNRDFTEKGFYLDLAKSRYLQLSVKKENLSLKNDSLVEDTRFNKVVSDGASFDEEGKYTITVQNLYTNLKTEKILYVGTDPIMKCNAVTKKNISEIRQLQAKGYTINSNGTLSPPKNTSNNSSTQNNAMENDNQIGSDSTLTTSSFDFWGLGFWGIILCVIGAIIVIAIIIGIISAIFG